MFAVAVRSLSRACEKILTLELDWLQVLVSDVVLVVHDPVLRNASGKMLADAARG
ncbi:hypothetical protein SCD_n02007 [Sulfuricella denitrificans skB26]|uniref:Uncharacterized protein n=1 Tax=Sulfuricella denitrificans (strain DSM 22764 / NBRC 105220 / skB26) TaxID=1163617 RepID=S6ACS5_SULDS|nr:hypothetical protein SCD_n02007 [Sulfuricella denitrificans skB26]